MEQDFYKGRLSKSYGLKVLASDKEDRLIIHNIV